MKQYEALYEFTDFGMSEFRRIFGSGGNESSLDTLSPNVVQRIENTSKFSVESWESAREMAAAVIKASGSHNIVDLYTRAGLWAWLAFVCRDQVYPKKKDGSRKTGELHKWFPSHPEDYQKAQRHLIRMPVLLLNSFGENADHLLCGTPSVPGEAREQLTSRQDLFFDQFQKVARTLYFDPDSQKLKRGAASKGAGSARRLVQIHKQFDVTWDFFEIAAEDFLEMLPAEFDKFNPLKS